jgi:hypothetical protein
MARDANKEEHTGTLALNYYNLQYLNTYINKSRHTRFEDLTNSTCHTRLTSLTSDTNYQKLTKLLALLSVDEDGNLIVPWVTE